MNFRFFLLLSLVFIGCSSESEKVVSNKFQDPELVKIYTLIDQRYSAAVAGYFKNPNTTYRFEAVQGFASIRDTAYVPQLIEMLKDSSSTVKAAAAYALGQIGIGKPLGDLIICHYNSSDTLVRGNCILAISKCLKQKPGSSDLPPPPPGEQARELRVGALKDMLRQPYYYLSYLDFYSNYERICWGNAFRELGQRGYHSPTMAHRVKYALHEADKDAKLAMAMGMTRLPESWFLSNEKYVIDWVKMERDSDVRAVLMTMLEKIKQEEGTQLLYGYATGSSQLRSVRIQALRAIGRMSDVDGEKLVSNFSDTDEGIVLETLQALSTHVNSEFITKHLTDFDQSFPSAKAMWLGLACKGGNSDSSTQLWSAFEGANGLYEKMAYLRAMAFAPSLSNNLLENVLLPSSTEAPLKYAAMETLVALYENYSGNFETEVILPGLAGGDIGVAALIGDLVASESYTVKDKTALSAALSTAEKKLVLPREVETQIAISKALNKLGASSTRSNEKQKDQGIDWNRVAKIDANQEAIIKTNKGDIVVRFDVNNAPGTVAYLVELIESGFYNNKYFHRVVPNFVIQAGCPRGDGMGSTDKTIRSEFNLHRYATGTLGMASAGPDTESCQWFITQWDTPHLEGRYTIFGKVVSGMEIVDQIQQGDQIMSITLK